MAHTPRPDHVTPERSFAERSPNANSPQSDIDRAASAALFGGENQSKEDNALDIDEAGRNITPLLEEFTTEINGTPDPERFVVTRHELRALAVRGYLVGYEKARSSDGAGDGA